MLTPLKRKATPVRELDAVDLLLECHDRIRRFMRMAVWLCHAHDAPDLAIADTAAAVLRYFTEALPRHSADEDRSVAPRLSTVRMPVEVTTAVASMTRQHEEMDQILVLLIPMWRAIAEDPRRLGEHAAEMERLVDRLRGLWDIHLHLEETVVFPAVRAHLSAPARAEVLREMRERRS